uniref:Major facilitator superfamily associated domain-containing protein n=1 Tax=Ciona savignyi TaxID=51511 RepID=H2ZQJ7_CIOSA
MVETVCSSHTRQECFHVNVRYLPLKILYFVYLAGQAASLVFQSVYMRHLGLSTKQTGMLWAVHRLVGVVATPLTGAIADKTGKSKTALCTLLACSAIVAASMAFVPIEAQKASLKIATCYVTNQTAQVVLPPELNRSLCKLVPVLQPWNVCNISLPTEHGFGQNLTETNNIHYVEMIHLLTNVHDSCHFANHNGRPVTCILPHSTNGSNFPRCAQVDMKS